MITGPPAVLDRARRLVDSAMRTALAGLNDELRLPAEYHFEGGGKGVRPALAVLSAESVGAEAEVAIPGAVAIELVHNYSLLHDDIIDGDRERRHRTTVWARFGIGEGIIVGDALHALAFEVLAAERSPERARATAELSVATGRMITGQSLDMAFDHRSGVTLEQCLAMERGKTGALLAYAASVGAILASAPEPEIDALRGFGMNLGIAFQAVDDILGIWGDPALTGKPAGSDIRERKRSVPVTMALAESEELRTLYDTDDTDDIDVDQARGLIESTGARERTEALALSHLDLALAAIEHDELADLARFVVEREF